MQGWIVAHGELALEVVKTVLLAIGGVWALWTFVIGRKFAPTIEFRVDANVLPYSEKENLIECLLYLSNKGMVRHKVRNLTIVVRGLRANGKLEDWTGLGSQVEFAELIVPEERLFPKKWEYSFIEPSVTQTYVYVAKCAKDVSHLLLHGEFNYRSDYPHTARKIIATAASQVTAARA